MNEELIRLLQNAYSGELAAFYAYEGHWRSLRDPQEIADVQKIQREEWEHRECIGRFLKELGAAPNPRRELIFTCIGKTISLLCRIGGWYIPMYGAGKLERGNIVEYEIAARMAASAGFSHMVDELLKMAEVEWDHELYFRRKAQSHGLRHLLRIWAPPPPRESIVENFRLECPDRPQLRQSEPGT